MTPQELDQYLIVLKAHGVIQAKLGDFSVAFSPNYQEMAEAFKAQGQAHEAMTAAELEKLQFAHNN